MPQYSGFNEEFYSVSYSGDESDNLDYDVNEMPKTVLSCWAINQAYQQSLKDFKEFLEIRLEENQAKQEEINSELTDNEFSLPVPHSTTNANSLTYFMTPYFKDKKGLHPPPNEDVTIKKMKGEINQVYIRSSSNWRVNEKKKLIDLVKFASFKQSLEPLKQKEDSLIYQIKKIEQEGEATDELYSLKFDLKRLEEKLKSLEKEDINTFIPKREDNETIDWLEISAQLGSSHSAFACEIKWLNELHPDINHTPWSEHENQKLKKLVEKYNSDWDKIAKELSTNRTSFQCICRYQTFLNSGVKRKGLFSHAEEELVNEVINNCRVGDYIPWNQVSYFIDGRSLAQVKHYWSKRNCLKKNKKWTKLEDSVLIQAVDKFGTSNWVKVAYFIPGRTNRQCRERYIMRLGIKNRKVAHWSTNEDKTLLELAPLLNYRWALLGKHLKGRNPHQIASRYDILEKASINKAGHIVDPTDTEVSLLEDSKIFPRRTRKSTQNEETADLKAQISSTSKDKFLRENRLKLQLILQREMSKKEKILEAKHSPSNIRTNKKQKTKAKCNDDKKTKGETANKRVEQELVKLFGLYSLYRKPTIPKGLVRTNGDTVITNNILSILKSSFTNTTPSQNHLLSQVIQISLTNFVTKKSDGKQTSLTLPPLMPPNIATLQAFHSLQLYRQHLSIEYITINRENTSSSNYKKILGQFISLFFWPYLLSRNSVPEKPLIKSSQNQEVKSKSRNRNLNFLCKTREKQRKLLNSVSK